MSSKVQICNLALSRLGAAQITSLGDGTAEAKLCSTFFDDLAEEVMIEGSWTSTIRRVALAQTTNTPAFGYSSEFQLPVDPKCLRVLNVNETQPGSTDYRIEGDKLLCDESDVKIRYIALLSDTEDWDPMLKRAFVSRLASELAYPLTGNEGKQEAEFNRYQFFLDRGLAIDGQQGSKEQVSATDLIDVR